MWVTNWANQSSASNVFDVRPSLARLQQIYNLMIKKVSAENFDYNLAESLPELAKKDGQELSAMMEEIETIAKKVISHAESQAQGASAKAKAMLFWSAIIGVPQGQYGGRSIGRGGCRW
jgi:hypothetical protein